MRLALVGQELSHSFSRDFFMQKFERDGINGSYDLIEVDDLRTLRDRVREMGLNGFNVTIPYKVAILELLDELTEDARAIGAVNCVQVVGERWIGHNTDHRAFADTLSPYRAGIRTAIVLGTGGASRAVNYALDQLGIAHRSISRSGTSDYRHLSAAEVEDVQLVVQTTPLGMKDELLNAPAIPYDSLGPDHLAYDLIYNPPKTLFLQLAEARGAMIMNGRAMLEGQALLSWKIWTANSSRTA